MSEPLCSAAVDGLCVGIPMSHVREIVRDRDITPVPFSGDAVAGLMNLRGDLVTVVDLRARLQRGAHPDPVQGQQVVLRGTPPVSLLVDAVGDVLDPAAGTTVAPPTTLGPEVRPFIREHLLLDDTIVLTLDVDRVAALSDALPGPVSSTEEHR